MKKLAIITAVITVTALAATEWQFQSYDRAILNGVLSENTELRQAVALNERLASGRQQTITYLESRLLAFTNPPGAVIRSDHG